MGSRKATSLLVISFVLLAAGCSGGESANPDTGEGDFQEGTLSSERTARTTDRFPAEVTGDQRGVLLRVEGAETRFSGICTVGDREYVISGTPSKTYSFEDRSFSCTIEKRDPEGNLKVTVVSGDSARSVQQTNAEGGTIDVSHGVS